MKNETYVICEMFDCKFNISRQCALKRIEIFSDGICKQYRKDEKKVMSVAYFEDN